MGHRGALRMLSAWSLAATLGSLAPAAARADVPVAPGAARLDGLAALIEPTAADVEPTLVLRSDVDLRARLKLTGEAGAPVLGVLPEGLLAAALDELVGEALIEREASRLGLDSPSRARVAAQRLALAQMAGGETNLLAVARAVGAGQRELSEIATRRATVAGFLEANLVGTTDVTNAEVERVYAAGGHPFEGQEIESAREPLRRWLGQQRMLCSVKRWVEGLRARAEVRLLVGYAKPVVRGERCDVGVAAPAAEDEPGAGR